MTTMYEDAKKCLYGAAEQEMLSEAVTPIQLDALCDKMYSQYKDTLKAIKDAKKGFMDEKMRAKMAKEVKAATKTLATVETTAKWG